MNLTISGRQLDVTPALRSFVTEKLGRATRHYDQVTDVRVVLTVDNQKDKSKRQRAECTVHVKGGELFAEAANEGMYAAIDELVDKLESQLARHKGKVKAHDNVATKHMV